MNGAEALVLPMKRGESKTPSSYDRIAICVSFFSRRPHAAPDRLCDATMTHARWCGAPGAMVSTWPRSASNFRPMCDAT